MQEIQSSEGESQVNYQLLVQELEQKLATIELNIARTEIGSCTCVTKTPDPQYHDERCTYRVLCVLTDG